MNPPSEICNQLYQLAHDHNGKNVWLEINEVPIFVVQNYRDADWVLRTNFANYHKNMAWFRQVLGASRFSENGEEWKIRKVLSQYYFNKFDRQRAYTLAFKYAEQTLATLVAAKSQQIDDNTLRHLTFSVLIENFFNIKLEETPLNIEVLSTLMAYASEYSFVPAAKTYALYRDKLALLPALRRTLLEDFKLFRSEKLPPNPMLAAMIEADRDPNNSIILEHELLSFFAAGAETTASALGWACYLLAKHPKQQASLRAALQVLVNDGEQDWQACTQLPLLTAFIAETLRLYPPTPIITRVALSEDHIGAEQINAQQNIMISFIGIQHDAAYYDNPWELSNRLNCPVAHEHLKPTTSSAFSIGPRICGGKHFALVELAGILSSFLLKGEFTLTSQAAPNFFWKSQMLHKDGQPVAVTYHT